MSKQVPMCRAELEVLVRYLEKHLRIVRRELKVLVPYLEYHLRIARVDLARATHHRVVVREVRLKR
jgi:hypothetical protein